MCNSPHYFCWCTHRRGEVSSSLKICFYLTLTGARSSNKYWKHNFNDQWITEFWTLFWKSSRGHLACLNRLDVINWVHLTSKQYGSIIAWLWHTLTISSSGGSSFMSCIINQTPFTPSLWKNNPIQINILQDGKI